MSQAKSRRANHNEVEKNYFLQEAAKQKKKRLSYFCAYPPPAPPIVLLEASLNSGPNVAPLSPLTLNTGSSLV
jgi:hypothetical protein